VSEPERPPGAGEDLDLLFGQLEELHTLAAEGASDDPNRLYTFKVVWGTLLAGRLPRLAYYAERGQLSVRDQVRYDELCHKLTEARPVIERLGVARPD